MRIALFKLGSPFTVLGATEAYYLYRFLQKKHRVWAVIPSDDMSRRAQDAGGIVGVPDLPGLPRLISFNLLAPFRLMLQANPFNLDVIYTYKGVVLPALLYKWGLGKKWICDFRTAPIEQDSEIRRFTDRTSSLQDIRDGALKRVYQLILPSCDLAVAVSEEVKQRLIKDYGVLPERVYVQPLGVDLDLFAPPDQVLEVDEELRLAYVGAITLQRSLDGLDTVIRAMARLRGRVPLRLVLVGPPAPQAKEYLETLAQQYLVEDRIDWRGYVPHTHVPRILAACHVALSPLPPLRAYEVSSPSKMFEYMAAGNVIIATDILAHRKLIRHRDNGLLVQPGDVVALAEALKDVYLDQELRHRLSIKARQSITDYSWDDLLARLEGRIQRLLEEGEQDEGTPKVAA